jgi:hypothetical protein
MRSIIVLAALLTAAGAWAQETYIDWDKTAGFENYKTFVWASSDEDLSKSSPLWHDRVVKGITERLVKGGMTELPNDETPDVYVTYFASESQKTRVVTDHMGYGYGAGYYGMGAGMGTSTSRVVTYDKGTLVIDIWDAKEKKLVWRGSSTDTISDNPKKMEKRLEKMLNKLVKVWNKEYKKAQKAQS